VATLPIQSGPVRSGGRVMAMPVSASPIMAAWSAADSDGGGASFGPDRAERLDRSRPGSAVEDKSMLRRLNLVVGWAPDWQAADQPAASIPLQGYSPVDYCRRK
jgi:hypothetical protein